MKRLLQFVFVCLLVIGLDAGIGFCFERLYRLTKTGEGGGVINGALSRDPDILLLGSSRMKHHVDPAILSKALGMSVFNAGVNGQGFLYISMLMDVWRQFKKPPRILVVNADSYLLLKNEEEIQKACVFSFFIHRTPLIDRTLYLRGGFEPLKYLSRSYRANGKVFSILRNLFNQGADNLDGFEPLLGSLSERSTNAVSKNPLLPLPYDTDYWEFKVHTFGVLADYCRENGVRFIVLAGPRYDESNVAHERWTAKLVSFLARYPMVEFFDISQFTYPLVFAESSNLFHDNSHLNARGAEIFSTLLAEKLERH
jgi:hypothetical protein